MKENALSQGGIGKGGQRERVQRVGQEPSGRGSDSVTLGPYTLSLALKAQPLSVGRCEPIPRMLVRATE